MRMILRHRRSSAAISRVEAKATENWTVEVRFERESDGAQAPGADRRIETLVRIRWTDGDRLGASQVAVAQRIEDTGVPLFSAGDATGGASR
jgi:hypothetical protein